MTVWGAELRAEAEARARALASSTAEQMAVLATFDPRRFDAPDVPEILRTLASPVGSRRRGRKRRGATGVGPVLWTLREDARIEVLARMLQWGGPEQVAAARDAVGEPHADTPFQSALDEILLRKQTPLDKRSAAELGAALSVRRWLSDAASQAEMSHKVDLGPSPEILRGALTQIEMMTPFKALLVNGCIGRDEELNRLRAWREGGPTFGDFASDYVMWVHGIGGMGKSTMVAQLITELQEASREGKGRGWAYIDYDRLAFRSGRTAPVLDEMLRQVGTQFPDLRRLGDAYTQIARVKESNTGLEGFESSEFDKERINLIGSVLAELVGRFDEPFVLVLDTFEELQALGSTPDGVRYVDILLEALHALASQVPRMRIVISGRAQPELQWLPVPEKHIVLVDALEGDDARDLLSVFAQHYNNEHKKDPWPIPESLAEEVIELVGGSPLTLKLAAHVLAEQGEAAIRDAAARAEALGEIRDEFVRGFLYRRIIDHLEPLDHSLREPLRAVARAALALRLVTREAIEAVLLPVLADAIDTSTWGPLDQLPTTLFQALDAHTSLHQSRTNDVLALHEDLRRPAFAALEFDDRELVRAVHDRAIAHFEASSEPWARAEFAYHRLMAGDPPDELVDLLTPDVLSSVERSKADLPPSAAEIVSLRHQDVASHLRDVGKARAAEIAAESRADSALRSEKLDEAHAALAKVKKRTSTSKLHRIESRIHEAAGDLEKAIEAQRADVEASNHAAHPRRVAAAAVRLAQLLERAGKSEEAMRALEEAEGSTLLHGHPLVRAELQLRRLNVAERRKLWKRDQQRAERRKVRAFMRDSAPRAEGTARNVLQRLQAAALGRSAPTTVRSALDQVGVGDAFGPEAVAELAEAMDDTRHQNDWMKAFPSEDTIVYANGAFDEEAMARHLGALSPTDAPALLRQIFETARKKKIQPVMEAIRGIYLWWDMPRPEVEEATASIDPEAPLDFRNKEVRKLAETLRHAYPEQAQLRRLADKSKVSLKEVRRTKSHAAYTRDIMKAAHGMKRLGKLVEVALEDPESKAFHPRLLNIVEKL